MIHMKWVKERAVVAAAVAAIGVTASVAVTKATAAVVSKQLYQ